MLESVYADMLILAAVMVLAHIIHNRINSLLSDAIIVSIGALTALYFVDSAVEVVIFIVGSALGYVVEFFGVYTRAWRYNTRNGYSNWTGTGWGLLILVIYKAQAIGWPVQVAILIPAVIIALRQMRNEGITGWFEVVEFVTRGLAFFIAPGAWVLSFSLGILVEWVGTELFPTWKYPKLRYLRLATAYPLLVILTHQGAEYAFGLREFDPLPFAVIVLYMVVYFISVGLALPPDSRLRRWFGRPAVAPAE